MIDGVEVIDFHGHVNRNDRLRMLADATRVTHAMDVAGIDRACVFHTGRLDGSGNELAARYAEANPNRFIPFAFTSPILGKKAVKQLEDAVDKLFCVAIKLYPPRAPWPLNDSHWFDIYRFADERNLAVIFHTGSEAHARPRFLGEIAPRFPRANFVAGHSGNIAARKAGCHHRRQQQPEHLSRNLLHLPHAGCDRGAGRRGRRRSSSLRFGSAAHGSATTTRQDSHRRHIRCRKT